LPAPVALPKVMPRPPVAQSTATARPPGPPAPAFAAPPPMPPHPVPAQVAQSKGANQSFRVDPAHVGLAGLGGRRLPDGVRGNMERALGADFSDVRVHVGPQAERIGAIAFTIGTDIYFAPGRFQPDTVHGRQLLGHELAHVVQQRQGRVRNPMGVGIAVVQDWALEAEADRLGHRAAATPTAPAFDIQRTAKTPECGKAQVIGQPRDTGANLHRTAQAYGGRAHVIQRIGQEAFGYEITATKELQGLNEKEWTDELKKPEPFKGLVPKTKVDVSPAQWRELITLTSILVMTIETLRQRASMWKRGKEGKLSSTLTTITDEQKVRKIKDALFGYDYPVPATNDLTTLTAMDDVQELFEISPRLKREVDWVEPSDRHATIKSHALTVDAPVRGALLESRSYDFETLKHDPILEVQMKQNRLVWAKNGRQDQIKTADNIVLITFYHMDAAFVPKSAATPRSGVHRTIYYKRGKSEGPKNEYVKDDKGVFTRRYAYVEKNKYQFRDLANQGYLAGRYPTQQSERANREKPYNLLDNFARNKVPALPRRGPFTNAYQLAYLHQELGSGHQQRGVSATSSPKYHIFSNAGGSFLTDDGVRIEVDLARLPRGNDEAPQLINHYAAAAKANMEPVIGHYSAKGRKFEHYQWSVKKNRELFIKELRPEHITSLTLHQTAGSTAHKEVRPGGFRQKDVVALGQHVGLAEYNAGFLAGSQGASSNPERYKVDKRTYYLAGYADGLDYASGYRMGDIRYDEGRSLETAGKNIPKLTDAKEVRYTQGFWDGYHGRQMRKN
jgi:hypothetical protein